jgi:MOB kinase activator 1
VPYYVCRSSASISCLFDSEDCSPQALRYEYLWEDGVRYKKPTKLPAPEYVDALMNWAQSLLDNEDVFPNKIGVFLTIWYVNHQANAAFLLVGVPFPKGFRETIRTLFRRLFRVYAHLYSNHFDHICALGIEGIVLKWDCSDCYNVIDRAV